MPAPNRKTGLKKSEQRKQILVYVDKWVDMHNTIEKLEREVNYWRIEAQCDNGRWLRALEDLEKLRNNL